MPETCTKHDADLQAPGRTTIPLLGAGVRYCYRYGAGRRGEHGAGEPGEDEVREDLLQRLGADPVAEATVNLCPQTGSGPGLLAAVRRPRY